MNRKQNICNAFNRAALGYDKAAQVQYEIGSRLFERLYLLKMQPRYILDLGCGPGVFTEKLKKLYPNAQVYGLDIAHAMLLQAKSKCKWHRKWGNVNADMHKLPFADGQFDLIFSNQVVHWSSAISDLMYELKRVMAKDACLMFSTLGPDTFQEIRQAFSAVDNFSHVNEFLDMHDLGDIVFAANFVDPVFDMDMLTVQYPSLLALFKGLKQQGVKNISSKRNNALTGKIAWSKLQLSMQRFVNKDNMYPLTYEVVYGHAWRGSDESQVKGTKNTISVADLKATLKTTKG